MKGVIMTEFKSEHDKVSDPDLAKGHDDTARKETKKKPFVKPELKRHETLPEVTAAFFASFQP
jgi:hypothetical protein